MLRALLNSLGVHRGERKPFMRLYWHSFLNGIFISFFATVAYAQFLNFHDTSELPIAFLVSGLSGYIIVWIYSRLQKRIAPARLYFFTLAFLLVLMVGLRVMTFFADEASGLEKQSAFILFVAFAPAQQLLFLEFGGISLQVFDLRQGKRFFGLISTGDILAAMIGFLIIPVLIRFLPFGADDLLTFTALVLLGCMAILRNVVAKDFSKNNEREEGPREKEQQKRSTLSLIKNPYIAFVSLLSLFSVFTAFFSDFLFLGTVKLVPDFDTELKLAGFISLFFGVVKVFEFVLSLVSSRILSQFGMKVGVTLFPFMMLGILLISAIAGLSIGQDITIFFLLVCLSQVIDRAVRKGIDIPAFRTLYQPLPSNEKLETQTIVDGAINQGGVFVSGLFLLAVGYFLKDPTDRMTVFAAICVPFMLAYSLIAVRMFSLYKKQLQNVMTQKGGEEEATVPTAEHSPGVLQELLASSNEVKNRSIRVLYQLYPYQLELQAKELLSSGDEELTLWALKSIKPVTENDALLPLVDDALQRFKHYEIQELGQEVTAFLRITARNFPDENTIRKWCGSNTTGLQMQALKCFLLRPETLSREYFFSLIRSTDDRVIRSCIHLLSLRNLSFSFPFAQRLINHSQLRSEVLAKIASLGDEALPYLQELSHQKDQQEQQMGLVQVCELLGTDKALRFLFNYLFTAHRHLQLEASRVLNRLGFHAENDADRLRVKELMGDVVRHMLWIRASLEDLEDFEGNEADRLHDSIGQDEKFFNQLLFELLGLIEAPKIVELVKENLASGEQMFALELVDNFLSNDIKEYLIPIIEEVASKQLYGKTKGQFSQRSFSIPNRLRNIVNHDYNKVSLASKSLAVEAMGALKEGPIPNEVFAGLFHHNELLHGAAAKVLLERENAQAKDYINTHELLPKRLVQQLEQKAQIPLLMVQKMHYLHSIPLFAELDSNYIIPLARAFTCLHWKDQQQVVLQALYNKVFIVHSGILELEENEEPLQLLHGKAFMDAMHIDIRNSTLRHMRDLVILTCDDIKFIDLISNHPKVLAAFIQGKNRPVSTLKIPVSA